MECATDAETGEMIGAECTICSIKLRMRAAHRAQLVISEASTETAIEIVKRAGRPPLGLAAALHPDSPTRVETAPGAESIRAVNVEDVALSLERPNIRTCRLTLRNSGQTTLWEDCITISTNDTTGIRVRETH